MTPAAAAAAGRTEVCFRPAPPSWGSALRAGGVDTPAGVTFGLAGLAGDAAFGQFNSASASGIGRLDLTSGRLTTLSTYRPGTSGLGGLAIDGPWVVWEQLDSQTNLADWSVHATNQQTGESRVLATSRLDGGGFVAGQQPIPVLRNGMAAWAQPVPGSGGKVRAEVRLVELSTGRERTLDTGGLSSPVFAGPYLIWATIDGAGRYALKAVDATTWAPVLLPAPLRHPDSIGHLAGSAGYLTWSSEDSADLTVWQVNTDTYHRFTSHDGRHHFQFMQLAGHFVLWFGGTVSSILDVTTGAAFDIAGTTAGSPERIATSEPIGPSGATPSSAPDRGHVTASRVSSIATASAAGIPACR